MIKKKLRSQRASNRQEQADLNLVKKNGHNLKNIVAPTILTTLAATHSTGYSIKHVENPAQVVQISAVRRNPCSIKYIENPTIEVQIEAVTRDVDSLLYIDKPSKKVQREAIKHDILYINKDLIRIGHEIRSASFWLSAELGKYKELEGIFLKITDTNIVKKIVGEFK